MEADAEGGQAAQQGADAVHLVGAKAQSAGGYEVVGPVVNEDADFARVEAEMAADADKENKED